jgi:hypothetical protein
MWTRSSLSRQLDDGNHLPTSPSHRATPENRGACPLRRRVGHLTEVVAFSL